MIGRPASYSRLLRVKRRNPGLESLAAEFAALAQRRIRACQRLAMLDHQRAATSASVDRLQARLSGLLRHIEQIEPALKTRPASPLAQIAREWIAAQSARRS